MYLRMALLNQAQTCCLSFFSDVSMYNAHKSVSFCYGVYKHMYIYSEYVTKKTNAMYDHFTLRSILEVVTKQITSE